jgi:hypothetical protein
VQHVTQIIWGTVGPMIGIVAPFNSPTMHLSCNRVLLKFHHEEERLVDV